jgi:hypothetical protein
LKIKNIEYLSEMSDANPDNDQLDIHVTLDDGREFTFVMATPGNVSRCMENEGIDYFFGSPMLFVKSLTAKNIERAIQAIVSEDGGRWLEVYGR